tara:strand:+ start:112 stop:1011 length:900 start_codon:yes stop_codon:yes gene_type:complete
MSVVQRKAMLKSEGFFPHKKNAKGTTIIYSRKHPTAKSVRVVIDSGIDSTTNKVVGKLGIKLCYVNRSKSWREISSQVFTTNTGLVKLIKAQEAAEKFVKSCKHCKAKKFTAKTGNVVCANACWTTWSGSKNATTNKTTKKVTQKTTRKKNATNANSPTTGQGQKGKVVKKAAKSSQKKSASNPKQSTAKRQRTYPLNKRVARSVNKKPQKKLQADILPGDLVTVEEILGDKVRENFTGKVLGIVQSIGMDSVKVTWTANTSGIEEYLLPQWRCYHISETVVDYRFKVLSRKVEYVIDS